MRHSKVAMSFPIVLAVGRSGDTYSNLYTGSSLADAQSALSAAITGATATIGWVFENPVPVATLRSVSAGMTQQEAVPVGVLYPEVSDIPSAIGLSRLGVDGRTVNVGDHTYAEALDLDESGKQLLEAEQQMTADQRKERHEFAVAGLEERRKMVEADQQDFEDLYARNRDAETRDITKDYTEAPFIKEQRAAEAERSERAIE